MSENIKARQKEYNAKEYFNSWYRSFDEFSDRITISPNSSQIETQYHYNLVENRIIEALYEIGIPQKPMVLDVGSGYGHWIDFYLKVLSPAKVYGNDISESCYQQLKEKYSGNEKVQVSAEDISQKDFSTPQKADIINAIGVMFHIVEDDRWEIALANLADALNDKGLLIIGGEFGEKTENVQFHKVDSYNSWEEKSEAWHKFKNTEEEDVFFNKRLRSYQLWAKTAGEHGLKIISHKIGNPRKIVRTPQNNLLVLQKA